MGKTGRYFLLVWVVVIGSISSGAADETTGDLEVADAPAYSNPAQAMHAANLAEAAAMQPNEELDAARQDVLAAEDALALAEKSGSEAEIAAAKSALEEAETSFAEAFEKVTGVFEEDILGLRESGMGWGQIAHELGVHPGTLGLGHAKKREREAGQIEDDWAVPSEEIGGETELAEATARDVKGGWAKGHGASAGESTAAGKGLGLSEGAQTKGNSGSKGEKGNSGNSANASGATGKGQADAASGPGNSGKDKSDNSNNGKGKGKDK